MGGQEIAITEPLSISLPEHSTVDREGFDWIVSSNSSTEIDSLYTDLVHQRAKRLAEKSTMQTVLNYDNQSAINAQESKVNKHIEDESQRINLINDLTSKYGQERLEKMSNQEFYNLYKSHVK